MKNHHSLFSIRKERIIQAMLFVEQQQTTICTEFFLYQTHKAAEKSKVHQILYFLFGKSGLLVLVFLLFKGKKTKSSLINLDDVMRDFSIEKKFRIVCN